MLAHHPRTLLTCLAARQPQGRDGSSYWDSEGGGEIDYSETGFLLVSADSSMQRRVDKVLEDLRRFASEHPK